MEDIYKVTFGMYYVNGEKVFVDDVMINFEDGSDPIPVSVYAKFDGANLNEVVTGLNIPLIKKNGIPGFGAYSLSALVTIEDMRDLVFNLGIAKQYKREYHVALNATKNKLTNINVQYAEKNSDTFGKLSDYSQDRENFLLDELGDFMIKSENLIEEFEQKTM